MNFVNPANLLFFNNFANILALILGVILPHPPSLLVFP